MSLDILWKKFEKIYPLYVEQFEEFSPVDNESITDKINKVIQSLNRIGRLSESVVKDWNRVFDWLMNEGLSEEVVKQLDKWKADGTFDTLLNAMFETINTKVDGFQGDLDKKVSYPILTVETGKVVNVTKPYGHVERYGADPTGINDSTIAIQTAVDLMEELAKGMDYYNGGFFPVRFGTGTYTIRKTIRIKSDTTSSNVSRPISLIGAERKNIGDVEGKGTIIRPYIPNHTGKTYANAISINVKYNSDVDEDDTTTFGGGTNAPIVDNVIIRNLSFLLPASQADNFTICAIKGYRYRSDVESIYFDNMWRGIWQPSSDRLGGSSYCDFSKYSDISINHLKYIGLELCTPDRVSIDRVIHHNVKSTFDCILRINNGGGITVKNFQSAFHGTYDSGTATLLPRNDGTGIFGSKAYIKLVGVTGISFDGLYTERPLADYMFSLTGCRNVSINNYYERFFGNGFMVFFDVNKNIKIENIYRHSNLVTDYKDFEVRAGASLQNLKIKNYLPRDWYAQSVSLATTDYSGLTKTLDSVFTTRDIKHNLSYSQIHQIEGEEVSFKIQYDGANWIAKDRSDNDITSKIGTISWNVDGLDLNLTSFMPFRLVSVSEGYVSSTSLPHVPIFRGIATDKIRFFDRATGNAISTPDVKCCVWVTINAVYNLTKLP